MSSPLYIASRAITLKLCNLTFYATLIASMHTSKSTISQPYVKVPKVEYAYLRALERDFRKFVNYMKEVQDTEEARADFKAGRARPMEEVFAELGL